jgi:hypothetical protein
MYVDSNCGTQGHFMWSRDTGKNVTGSGMDGPGTRHHWLCTWHACSPWLRTLLK